MEIVQKQLSAICLDFQIMVDILFVQVVPVLLLLWHTWQAHYVSEKKAVFSWKKYYMGSVGF